MSLNMEDTFWKYQSRYKYVYHTESHKFFNFILQILSAYVLQKLLEVFLSSR
jgi:hypothetical protein